MNGSEIVARSLKRHGVEVVFYLMGGPMTALLDACVAQDIQMVDVRHEQAAAMMAHAYARLLRRPAVCIASSGPGTMNLVTGIAGAFVDSAPVIALVGSSPIRAHGIDAFQEIDQVGVFKPITRWCDRVYETRRLAAGVDAAFDHAYGSRPGPVVLDLPGDVLNGETSEEPDPGPARGERMRPLADPEEVKDAVALIASAQRPVIMSGSGVLWAQADREFGEFVDVTGIPFYTTPQGRGVIPEDHPLYFAGARSTAFRDADLLIAIGTRQNYVTNHMRPPRWNADAKLIQLDIDPAELGRNRRADVALLGDAKAVLSQLIAAANGRLKSDEYAEWVATLRDIHEPRRIRQEQAMAVDTRPIHPLRLCKEVRDFLPRDAVLVVDGLVILDLARQSIPFYQPHSLNSGPLGTMGVGVPFGLGAQVAMPDKRVVIVHGDGGFGMNGIEMDTAVRLNLPVICVVHNNGGWGTNDGKKTGGWLGHTRYDLMAQALGCYAELVDDPDEIRPALDRAAASGRPALINVIVDSTVESQTSAFTEYATH